MWTTDFKALNVTGVTRRRYYVICYKKLTNMQSDICKC